MSELQESATSLPTVLLAEGDASRATIYAGMLRRAGFIVTVARTGADALRAAETAWHLIVCDLGLSDMSGVELISSLRSTMYGTWARIIAITASPIDEARQLSEALTYGADEVYPLATAPLILSARFEAMALRFKRDDTAQVQLKRLSDSIDALVHTVTQMAGDVEELKKQAADVEPLGDVYKVGLQVLRGLGRVGFWIKKLAPVWMLLLALVGWVKTGEWRMKL